MLRKSLIFLGEKIVWNLPYINASFLTARCNLACPSSYSVRVIHTKFKSRSSPPLASFLMQLCNVRASAQCVGARCVERRPACAHVGVVMGHVEPFSNAILQSKQNLKHVIAIIMQVW